jgi:cytochrome c-type biogenesis protein CcmH
VKVRRALAALIAFAVLAPFAASASAIAATCPRTSLPDVEKEVMCPVCGLPLNVSSSAQADRERVYIRALVARCETKAQIKQALVGQFGPAVLALPRSGGFNTVVYVVPIAVVAVLSAIVALLLPRWRRRSRRTADASAPPLDPADAARLNDELARYDR